MKRCDCGKLLKAIDAFIEKAEGDLKDELAEAGFAEAGKTIDAISALEGDVAAALIEETELFNAAIAEAGDLQTFARDIWPSLKENDKLAVKLKEIFKNRFSELMPGLVDTYLKQTDSELAADRISNLTLGWIEEWSGQLAELMQLNSHTEIEAILETGLANGDGIAEFAQNILDSGIRDEYYKARRVSLTEVLRAHNVAHQEATMQSPVVTHKMWRHTGSYRNEPRENHVAMDGQTVGKAERFTLQGRDGVIYYPMYPIDPILPASESINCHCISEDVVDPSILGMSLEERQALQQEAIDAMDAEWEAELAAIDAANRAKAGIE